MRFSEMMGSDAEQPSEPPAPSETDDVVASALAPYLDAAPAAEPVAQVVPFERVVPDESGTTTIADFTPLSDDLLPHRR
jgi:hypothetical protein